MINTKSGEIILCNSRFNINKNLKASTLEESIPDLIIRKDITNGYIRYYCWGDIERDGYVYLTICFYKNNLYSVEIHPQNHSDIPEGIPYCSDCNTDIKEVSDWYYKFFQHETQRFKWGEVRLLKGTDSIYHPTVILILF